MPTLDSGLRVILVPVRTEHYPQLFAYFLAAQKPAASKIMKSMPQRPHTGHPVALVIRVAAQTADPQHCLADRQFRRLHPFAEVAHQRLNFVPAQHLKRRRLRRRPCPRKWPGT